MEEYSNLEDIEYIECQFSDVDDIVIRAKEAIIKHQSSKETK